MKLSIALVFYFFVIIKGESERIAGGTVVTIASYPFAVALLSNNGSGAFAHACGGSILTNTAILSSASCFHTNGTAHPVSWWRARVGSSFSNAGGTIYIINRITTHPSFSATTLDNDVAVLRTRLSIEYQGGVVEAARIVGAAHTFANNQAVWAIGWGATSAANPASSEQLRQAQIWVVNQQTCVNRYNEVGFNVTSNMVCVGWLDVGVRGQCQGDGGSPLVDDGAVVGVFSWAEGCAQGRYPNINTRVANYTQWIIATARAA